jgi:predicted phosphodiesterase
VEIAIISDTHMPREGRRLPDRCVSRLQSAQLILHAGDPGSPTERRRAPQHTMGIARADMGQLTFELVSLG